MAERNNLETYRKKRDFRRTSEPPGGNVSRIGNLFMIHKHDASRLHYDLRLQIGDVLKSWAVPKGPSLDPAEKRFAAEVEDHPLEYGGFEGVIPEGQYGAGPTLIWDRGAWAPMGDIEQSLKAGTLKFRLAGEKLKGGWTLVRMRRRAGETKNSWLLIKEPDDAAATRWRHSGGAAGKCLVGEAHRRIARARHQAMDHRQEGGPRTRRRRRKPNRQRPQRPPS